MFTAHLCWSPCPYHFFTFARAQNALSLCLKGYLLISSRSISNIPFSVQPEVSHFLCCEGINDWMNPQSLIKYLLSAKCLTIYNLAYFSQSYKELLFFSLHRWGPRVLEIARDFSQSYRTAGYQKEKIKSFSIDSTVNTLFPPFHCFS